MSVARWVPFAVILAAAVVASDEHAMGQVAWFAVCLAACYGALCAGEELFGGRCD